MTRKFQVGDRVRVIRSPKLNAQKYAGAVGVIVRFACTWEDQAVWRVDFDEFGELNAANDALRPVHDGDEKLSWSDERVVWRPAKSSSERFVWKPRAIA